MKNYYSLKEDGLNRVIMSNGQPAKHFFIREFKNIDGVTDSIVIDPHQVLILDQTGDKFGLPIYIQVANRNLPWGSYHNPEFGNSCATDFDVGNADLGAIDYMIVARFMESIGAKEIGVYNYLDLKGKLTKFIHMDMGGLTNNFWICNELNPDGSHKLVHIKTFVPPPLIPYPEPDRILRWIRKKFIFRMKGNDVKWVQYGLNLYRIQKGQPLITVDGDFAGETDWAVNIFQYEMGFRGTDLDSKVGPITIAKLKSVLDIK